VTPDYLWPIIIGMTVITFAERFLFIGVLNGRELPGLLRRALRFVPAAALAAIVVPDFLYRNGQLLDPFTNVRLVAGLVAAVVAFRTKNVLLTISTGMIVLWGLQALVR
jgi:branched-subunit amino acid transport protein